MAHNLHEDYTFMFGNGGIVLNTEATATEPFVDVEEVTGLDMAEFRVTERVREGQDGGFIDAEFENMRTVIIKGTIYGSATNLHSFLDELKADYAPSRSSKPFYFVGDHERVVFAKSLGFNYPWSTDLRTGRIKFQIILKCEDPTVYDNHTVTSQSTGMAVIGTGRGYDKSFNYGYGAIPDGAAGAVIVSNSGNKPVPGLIRITNASMPVVQNDNNGRWLAFNITLAEGDFLDIDLRNRTVMLNGTANRRGTLKGGSRWFLLDPGITNLRFLGNPSGTSAPSMQVTHMSGYR
jgi:hypothetical protein